MNIRVIDNDSASVLVEWTDDEPDGVDVFATLTEAKQSAIDRCISERDAWAGMVRHARTWTRADVQ